jgi:lysophospholipase L1-like esterase
MEQFGESVVFIGEEPAALAHGPLRGSSMDVRNTYTSRTDSIRYVEGKDFTVDYQAGTLRRTEASRIPDFRTNVLFGQHEFDHTKFPGFGNSGYFVFVDYSFTALNDWPAQAKQTHLLPLTREKLREGRSVKIVAFGDSITAGGDASSPGLIFWRRWAESLQQKHPSAQIEAVNGATGGDTTVQGLERLQTKVIDQKPDLVLIGFGMNDHNNIGSVPVPQFEANLKRMITRVRDGRSVEIILFSAFPPNPEWKFGSHHMQDYAAATRVVAEETGCAYADVFNNWQSLAARKKPEDLLGNNINHPNDFGHWIYFRVLEELGL